MRRLVDPGSLPAPPPADPQFRARLRASFMASAIDRPERAPARPPRWRTGLPRAWFAPAAVAAALLFFAFLRDGTSWRIEGAEPGTRIVVEGRVLDPADTRALAGALRVGARVQVRGGAIDLRLPRIAHLQAADGADFTLPRVPRGGSWRRGRSRVFAGELRMATLEKFPGRAVEFELPEASARVTGTVLAVIREPGRSCVCVFEGRVDMRDQGGAVLRVAAGTRRSVAAGGRNARVEALRPMESAKLGMLRDRIAR